MIRTPLKDQSDLQDPAVPIDIALPLVFAAEFDPPPSPPGTLVIRCLQRSFDRRPIKRGSSSLTRFSDRGAHDWSDFAA